MTFAVLGKAIALVEAEPIGQQAIDDMKSVLAKEGHLKAAAIRKIFASLEPGEISPEEVCVCARALLPQPSYSGSHANPGVVCPLRRSSRL